MPCGGPRPRPSAAGRRRRPTRGDPRLVRPRRLRLPPRARRPPPWDRGVVVRVTSPTAAAREAAWHAFLAGRGYPVPPMLGVVDLADATGTGGASGACGDQLGQGPSCRSWRASASTRSPSRSCCGRWPRRTPASTRSRSTAPRPAAAGRSRSPPSTATSTPRASPPTSPPSAPGWTATPHRPVRPPCATATCSPRRCGSTATTRRRPCSSTGRRRWWPTPSTTSPSRCSCSGRRPTSPRAWASARC